MSGVLSQDEDEKETHLQNDDTDIQGGVEPSLNSIAPIDCPSPSNPLSCSSPFSLPRKEHHPDDHQTSFLASAAAFIRIHSKDFPKILNV